MRIRAWLLLSMFASAITYAYVSRILGPWEHYVDVEQGTLKAQMGDLYSSWLGTRELLRHGRNPYGPEVSHEIQMAFYGRIIQQQYDQPGTPVIDEQRFAYPVYVVLLLAPTTGVNFASVQRWVPVIFALLTAISVIVWLNMLRWHPPPTLIAAIILFVISSPQVVQGLRLRQLGLLVAFLLTIGAWCIFSGHLVAAGFFLALGTLKPQMALLPLAWFFVWTLGGFPKRWPLAASFGISLAMLVGIGEVILPGWPRHFINGVSAYRFYSSTTSILNLLLGKRVAAVFAIFIFLALLSLAWQSRHAKGSSWRFIYILAIFCSAAPFVLRLLTPFNQVLLLLPVLIVIRGWETLPRAGRYVFVFTVAWPSIISLILLLLHIRIDSTDRFPLLPSVPSLIMPFLLLLLLSTNRIRTGQTETPDAVMYGVS